jgi:hypothetical protein
MSSSEGALYVVRLVQNHALARACTFVLAYLVYEMLAYILPASWAWFKEVVEGIWDALKEVVKGIWSGIKLFVTAVLGWLRALFVALYAIICLRIALFIRGTVVSLACWFLYPYCLAFFEDNNWINDWVNQNLTRVGMEVILYYLSGSWEALKARIWGWWSFY